MGKIKNRKKHIFIVSIVLSFVSVFAFQLNVYAFDATEGEVKDLRTDKSTNFNDFLTSDTPKTYYWDTELGQLVGVREHNDQEKRDFEAHRIKHEGGPISNNGHDVLLDGNTFDFALAEDLRVNKTISFRDFMNSDAQKTFYIDAELRTITGVSDGVAESRTVVSGCTNIDACMIGRQQNYGVRGLGENLGKWSSIQQYRQYNYQGQLTTDGGFTIAGIQPGDTHIFTTDITIVEVILL
ncbi:MAG: hypothetical protein LBC50_01665 [Candidatus Ancillula sp.]|jgi:hypothetical protein|nr:hypothetical protein [Candidatus Ancillula sp.]